MGKGRSKNKAQRSSSSLPKGIPHKRSRGGVGGGTLLVNPFETARNTNSALRVKHPVHNKTLPGSTIRGQNNIKVVQSLQSQSSLAKSIARRKQHLSYQLSNEGKANVFIDRRIGEAAQQQQQQQQAGAQHHHHLQQHRGEDVMLKRIVQERVRRSKKRDKFHLTDGDDDDDNDDANYNNDNGLLLTHRGQTIDEHYTGAPMDHHDVLLSDDDMEDLDKVDTMLHFGGGKFDSENRLERGAYNNNYGNGGSSTGLGDGAGGELGRVYRSRREELEDRIQMKKMLKAEKLKRKENQAETFETMDESFAELAQLLNFRDKEQERVQRSNDRRNGQLSKDDMEMDDWDKEMKEYLFTTKKAKATDRTKTPEELAKEQADKLHALESKRLARMAGDFLSEDEFSDISDDDGEGGSGRRRKRREREKKDDNGKKKSQKKKKKSNHFNPEELGDSDENDEDEEDEGNTNKQKREVRFTPDGLVYVDKQGNVLGKVGEEVEEQEQVDNNYDETDSDGEEGSKDDSNEEDEEESSDEGMDGRHNLGDTDDEASATDDDASSGSDSESTQNQDSIELREGMAIQGNYHANEQFENWFNGTITSVRKEKNGQVVYDVTYDDGDFEEGMVAENVRPLTKSAEEKKNDKMKRTEAEIEKQKKQKAKLRAK